MQLLLYLSVSIKYMSFKNEYNNPATFDFPEQGMPTSTKFILVTP